MRVIEVDFRSEEPLYQQILQQIYARVHTGDLNPGAQLPTVRQLAAELGVNFNTVARAYRLLNNRGVISTQQGRGTFVLEAPAQASDPAHHRAALHSLTRRYLDQAIRLGFTPAEIVQAMEGQFPRTGGDDPAPPPPRGE